MNLKQSIGILLLGSALTLLTITATAAETYIPLAGQTRVTLSSELVLALESLNVRPGAIKPATLRASGVASFPVTTGAIQLPSAEVDHSGGLSLTAGGTRIILSSFIIDTTQESPVLTGLVIANGSLIGRVPLFDLDLGGLGADLGKGRIRVNNVGLTLTAAAADALNNLFSVEAFKEGIPIGTANVTINRFQKQ